MAEKVNINNNIRAPKLRVIGSTGENLGVLTKDEAMAKAKALGLDLIEVSPQADPPVARIADYGKYTYETSKKLKEEITGCMKIFPAYSQKTYFVN